ncbi:AAA family ATPase [Microbacterium sp. M3]|uniref:AAA family ATPase n=1 Tax=Microbacterium arthrosphaerae TaxID=792652 RepID=A0ABU4H2Z2_9MICO|nr:MULTISPECIES: AAA family ATPase [Microbacterium]MDW4573702.1 AAA family ATPase [Microbacterium arthrosphaerae]MDW7607557.1 AAA family ATPase [Microbacterium sp. M3]
MLRESVQGGPDLQSVLLSSKIQTPPLRKGAVSRRALIDRARESGARVVSVTAPAGYGKSTLLTEWAATDSRNVAWVSLDRSDIDPASLLSVIAAAAVALSPAAAEVVADMRGIGAAALGRSAPLLAGALAAAPDSFVLFVDDLHWADSPDCQDALEVLFSRLPEGSQIVLASRREPPLIGRLRAAGDAWEIAMADLLLGHADARVIFHEAGADDVDDADLHSIVERCEGWPTGLFLCALVARSGGDAASVTGDDRYLADYLYRECVARLPEDMQSFLRRSAVLDQLSAASCNAVLGIEDARARLHELEAANLFLVAMDRRRGWFRFHSLFREFLLVELERADGAAVVTDLHRRAAAWHQEHGASAQAVEHLLWAGETERAADRIAELGLPMYQRGEVSTVKRWLSELGDDLVRSYPPLVVSMAWTAILLGDVAAGERWSRILGAVDLETIPEDSRTEFESARAMVRSAMGERGVDRIVADAAYAMKHEPVTSPWRDQAVHLWATACLLTDDLPAAKSAFEEAIDLATMMGNTDTVILSEPELAMFAIDAGRWDAAARHADRGVAAIDDSHMDGYPTTALALAVAARVAVRDGDREQGKRLLARGMRARIGCTHLLPVHSIRSRIQLAKAHVALGDRSAAWHLVREIDELLRKRPDVGALSSQVEALRAGLAAEPAAGGSVPLTPAELRLLPYLQTHLTIAEIGQRLFISRNTVSSEVGSIYRKLAVTTRGAAVERASALGLLGG